MAGAVVLFPTAEAVMKIVAHHTIHDPEAFWAAAARELPGLPEGFHLHHSFPNETMARAVCLWEAPSVEVLAAWLAEKVGHVSDNELFAVHAGQAIGLPEE